MTQKKSLPSIIPFTPFFWHPVPAQAPIKPANNALQVMQEVDFHWRSGRSLPAQAALTAPHANPTTVETCFCSIGAALACRRHSVHDAQVSCVSHCQAP